eukprot:GEMP01005118.1.p1 GENE.GEMP01005118.1~~GEMP01005118.1.p1  ORF type:complete len:914 (+),score=162.16 GEMP01005118.1:404-3145(+)
MFRSLHVALFLFLAPELVCASQAGLDQNSANLRTMRREWQISVVHNDLGGCKLFHGIRAKLRDESLPMLPELELWTLMTHMWGRNRNQEYKQDPGRQAIERLLPILGKSYLHDVHGNATKFANVLSVVSDEVVRVVTNGLNLMKRSIIEEELKFVTTLLLSSSTEATSENSPQCSDVAATEVEDSNGHSTRLCDPFEVETKGGNVTTALFREELFRTQIDSAYDPRRIANSCYDGVNIEESFKKMAHAWNKTVHQAGGVEKFKTHIRGDRRTYNTCMRIVHFYSAVLDLDNGTLTTWQSSATHQADFKRAVAQLGRRHKAYFAQRPQELIDLNTVIGETLLHFALEKEQEKEETDHDHDAQRRLASHGGGVENDGSSAWVSVASCYGNSSCIVMTPSSRLKVFAGKSLPMRLCVKASTVDVCIKHETALSAVEKVKTLGIRPEEECRITESVKKLWDISNAELASKDKSDAEEVMDGKYYTRLRGGGSQCDWLRGTVATVAARIEVSVETLRSKMNDQGDHENNNVRRTKPSRRTLAHDLAVDDSICNTGAPDRFLCLQYRRSNAVALLSECECERNAWTEVSQFITRHLEMATACCRDNSSDNDEDDEWDITQPKCEQWEGSVLSMSPISNGTPRIPWGSVWTLPGENAWCRRGLSPVEWSLKEGQESGYKSQDSTSEEKKIKLDLRTILRVTLVSVVAAMVIVYLARWHHSYKLKKKKAAMFAKKTNNSTLRTLDTHSRDQELNAQPSTFLEKEGENTIVPRLSALSADPLWKAMLDSKVEDGNAIGAAKVKRGKLRKSKTDTTCLPSSPGEVQDHPLAMRGSSESTESAPKGRIARSRKSDKSTSGIRKKSKNVKSRASSVNEQRGNSTSANAEEQCTKATIPPAPKKPTKKRGGRKVISDARFDDFALE